jgi:alanine racemase
MTQPAGASTTGARSARRPTWIELDLGALGRNVAGVVKELAGVPLMAVVKANAYGHGSVPVARTALESGASRLATATVEEALELRQAGIDAPIVVLGYTPPEQVPVAVAARLAITVFDPRFLEVLERAGEQQGRLAIAHVKVDTGMSRLGLAPEALVSFMQHAAVFSHIDLEGCFTHFRKGEDRAVTLEQLGRFESALAAAESAGHRFRIRHAANSAAWHTVPESRFDLVRSGIELLGLRTPDGRQREPILRLRATVAQVRTIEPGTAVGYGDRFRAQRRMRVATVTVGYGDGFRRSPRNWGGVLIRGRERPLVGEVSMDLSTVDVSESPRVFAGDVATLIGPDGRAHLSAEEVADRLGTVNYEVTTALRARMPREAIGGVDLGDSEYN